MILDQTFLDGGPNRKKLTTRNLWTLFGVTQNHAYRRYQLK